MLLIAAVVLAADQFAKWVVVATIGPDAGRHRIELLGDAIALDYLENRGVAFGLLNGRAPIAGALAAAALLAVLVGVTTSGSVSRMRTLGAGLVVGGVLGNLLDRLRLGYVVDFVDIGPWPTFNVADASITVGVLLLVWVMSRSERTVGEPADRAERFGRAIGQAE